MRADYVWVSENITTSQQSFNYWLSNLHHSASELMNCYRHLRISTLYWNIDDAFVMTGIHLFYSDIEPVIWS